MNSPEDSLDSDLGPNAKQGLHRLLFDLEDLSRPELPDEDLENVDDDQSFLEETRENERRLAQSTYWMAATYSDVEGELHPVRADQLLRQHEVGATEETAHSSESNEIWLLVDKLQPIACQFQTSATERHRGEVLARWPDDRRPYQLCLLEVLTPLRPVSRTILQASTKPATAPLQSSAGLDRFLLPLQNSPSPADDAVLAQQGFQVILSESTHELVISTQRSVNERNCLPVLLQINANPASRRVVVLNGLPDRPQFVGVLPVESEHFRDGQLRCEVREIQWTDLPQLSPQDALMALSGRRQMAIRLASSESSLAYHWEDWHRSFLKDVPDAIVGLQVTVAGGDPRE